MLPMIPMPYAIIALVRSARPHRWRHPTCRLHLPGQDKAACTRASICIRRDATNWRPRPCGSIRPGPAPPIRRPSPAGLVMLPPRRKLSATRRRRGSLAFAARTAPLGPGTPASAVVAHPLGPGLETAERQPTCQTAAFWRPQRQTVSAAASSAVRAENVGQEPVRKRPRLGILTLRIEKNLQKPARQSSIRSIRFLSPQ